MTDDLGTPFNRHDGTPFSATLPRTPRQRQQLIDATPRAGHPDDIADALRRIVDDAIRRFKERTWD